MKKLLLTPLLVMLFALYGIAQTSSIKAAEVSAPRANHKVVPVAKEQITEAKTYSAEEKTILDNLKTTDVTKYKAYLADVKDIATLKKCLISKNLNPAERKQLESKIRLIESSLETKFGL